MSTPDLTRWNRAGLSRLRYVDGNAAVYFDLLREALRERFGLEAWPRDKPPKVETDERRRTRRAKQYVAARGDWGEELARTLARASHILTEYLDAYANESTLRTATQWDHLRRLVEMLDYHPAPPASAATPLVLMAKKDKRGRLAKGFAVKYAPLGGGAPVVFETLADLELDERLNELRLAGHDRSPEPVTGATLRLEERVAGLRLGDPVVLENEVSGYVTVRLIAGLREEDGATTLLLDVPVDGTAGERAPGRPGSVPDSGGERGPRTGVRPGGGVPDSGDRAPGRPGATLFRRGELLVHIKPVDRLAPLAPARPEVSGVNTLLLADEPHGLSVDQIAFVSDGTNSSYLGVAVIDGRQLQFDKPLGTLQLDQTYVSRAREAAVVHYDGRLLADISAGQHALSVAGDLSALQATTPLAVADASGQLELLTIIDARYYGPSEGNSLSGLTVLRFAASLSKTPVKLYLPPPAQEWKADPFLHDPQGAQLPPVVTTSLPKETSAGDFVVVAGRGRLGWGRLDNVAVDPEAGRAELAVSQWNVGAGRPFYLTETRVYGRFAKRLRVRGWDRNHTPLPDASTPARLPIPAPRSELLVIGRRLWLEQKRDDGTFEGGREATVTGLDAAAVLVDPPLADGEGFTVGNTVVRGNVVNAGHGERQNERILGSGDASALKQFFVLAEAGASFVADPTMPAGVRADIDVVVDERTWQQVGTLNDSEPGDAHYAVRMTEQGFLRIEFGDGEHGRRLPTGANNVRVRHRLGSGLAGNLPARSLEKPARPSPLVDKLRQPVAASGGGDMEGAAALRRQAPASLLTLERAVSADDYAHLAAAHAAVWRARAFRMQSALRRPRIEVVVVPAGGGELDERLVAALESFLAANSLPGVDVTVSGFVGVRLHLEVRLRVVSAEYDPKEVKAQALARLAEAFALRNRDLGANLYVSDVYAVVENIAGVRNSSCTLAAERGRGGAAPAGQRIDADPREVVFLDAAERPGSLRVEVEEFSL
jgi:hypothetical protein